MSTDQSDMPDSTNSGRRVEDNLRAIHTIHQPVQGMVPAVAYIDGYTSILRIKNTVTCVSLHVVRGLVM